MSSETGILYLNLNWFPGMNITIFQNYCLFVCLFQEIKHIIKQVNQSGLTESYKKQHLSFCFRLSPSTHYKHCNTPLNFPGKRKNNM